MADRAQYLARTLVARIRRLQAGFAEDNRGEPDRRQRIEAIEKVLAVELGITDGATLALVEAAIPALRGAEPVPERELAGFGEFLRQRLGRHLTEP